MKLVYKNPVELAKIFSAISVIVNEVNLDFNEDGLSIFGLDSSHVSMIFLKLNKEDCLEYMCIEPVRLGINLKTLTSILQTGKESDNVVIENNELDSLNIVIQNDSRKIEYEIKLMEIVMEDLFIPELEYPISLITTSGYFYNLLESISVIGSDDVNIKINSGKMIISGNGQLGNTRIELDSDEKNKDYKLECNDNELDQRFALVFIVKSKKIGDISKKIKINMGDSIPIQMEYKIGEKSDIKYMLAPKIED